MGSVRLEVGWSPVHENKFVTWGTDISLYEIGPVQDVPSSTCVRTSDTTQAVLLATNSTHRFVKCIDIHPQDDPDLLLAVGQANGKVVLTSFGNSRAEVSGRELSPLHARQCNSVAWNRSEVNVLAVGLEKSRTEPAVVLWDAFKCPHHYSGDYRAEYMKPLAEFCVSDAANSLSWVNSHLLIVGVNNKSLRIIDRRDKGKVVQSTATKAVYGLTVDTYNDQIVASFFENQISVWDVRNFEKPISTISRMKTVSKIAWCPTRHLVLGSLQRDSNALVLHDLQLATLGNEEVEPTLLERSVQPSTTTSNITSFSWHPTMEGRLLAISIAGAIIDYHVIERITLNWLPCSHLVWTHGRRTLKVVSDQSSIYHTFQDISVLMKKRALSGYGLKKELWQNGELAEDMALKQLWVWLHHSRSLVEEGVVQLQGCSHPGVMSTLIWDASKPRSELHGVPWTDVGAATKVYTSEERSSALQLCGWRFEKDPSSLRVFLDRLQYEGHICRAAAIAVFNLKLRLAISILNQGAATSSTAHLSLVAMALAGFTDDSTSMWREHCVKLLTRLQDPYLRAVFAFLTAEGENYDGVLNEAGVSVEDRVAFACTFLSDVKLQDYLTRLTEKLTEEAQLPGMLLTGATAEGVNLLQRYLDVTGDVQSVSLLAVRAFSYELVAEPSVQSWIASYQQLLDTQRLWNQRAHFDVALNSVSQCDRVPQQVFVSCNFCGKTISAYVQSRVRQTARVTPTNKQKMSSCPNCRKPLPRCAICLVHMGTPTQGAWDLDHVSDTKTAELASWFTWCQTCRHGGHAGHMAHWFSNSSECPVTGCTCKCMSLDAASNSHS